MRFFGKHSHGKRGVGSIIGAVFIVLIILSGFTFYSLYSGITDHYNKTLESMSSSDWNRNKEKLVIKDVKITATNQLNATVENQGTVQSHLIWFGLFNMSVVPESQTYYALDTSVDPAEVKSVVSDFTVVRGNKYVVQLVTELGNEIEHKFYPASEVRCALSLTTGSPTAYQGNNVTLMLTVKLNDTEVDSIQSLTVSIAAEPNGLVQLMGNSSLSVEGLAKGESAFFWWIYNAVSIGTVTFNATYSQAPNGTYALSTVNILASPGGAGLVTITGVNRTTSYNPLQWNLLGATQYVSGSISDLANDDVSYGVFRSYQTASSAQPLYAHSETTTIGGTPYYLQKITSADGTATSLSASMGTVGRQLFGKFVYPLTSVSSIPAGTWTIYYRAWRDASTQVNPTNNPGSTSGGWTNPTNAYANGGGYAYSTVNANSQVYGGYGFSIPSGAQIIQVRVRLDAWSDGNDDTRLEVSTNGGSSWLATSQTINVAGSETTYWIDVTSWTSWTPTAINNDNIRARVTHVRVGGAGNTQYLDYIPIEVTYTVAPTGHCDVDILIRRSGGSVRATIATNVATSGNLTSTAATLSGAYSWAEYVVVDQADYLEIDYYVDVTTAAAGLNAYLRIDDATLAISDQTRITDIMLPNEYTAEVEFTGSSNIETLTQLVWQIDSAWDVGQATVTIQFFNFTLGDFAPSGNGYISYISSATPNIDELKSQSIDLSPNDLKNSTGYWRVKIKGIKATSTQLLMKIDWIDFETTYSSVGDIIPYNVWQWYTIKATTASGDPIPYAYVSVYANGTSVAFRNVTDKTSIVNPAWVRLNANGEFQLEIRSTSESAETFVLYAVVGSVVGQKTIVQEAS